MTGGLRRTTTTSRASTALLRRQVDERGFQESLCRSCASSRAWELELVSGVGGVQAQSSSTSIYKRGHHLPYSRGLQKWGLMEVTKLLDSESSGQLLDGPALGWLVPYFLQRNKASQVALVVKSPSANAGDKRHGFRPWVGKTPWRRAWWPSPVLLPGESHGHRSLGGCSLLLLFSRVWLLVTAWSVAGQAPLSTGFSRQEDWSGLPFPSLGSNEAT